MSSPYCIDEAHLTRQREFSLATFGPGTRAKGVVDHIRKELVEIEADPADLGEWVDVIILGFDGALRAGHDPADIIAAIKAKQERNEARTWPDWRTRSEDEAIEHDRTGETAPSRDQVADRLAQWMFEHDYGERGLATPDVATWDEYADRNQEEWREEAGTLIAVVDDLRAGRQPSVAPGDRW